MSALPVLLALATPATILAVRLEPLDSRQALRVLAVGELGEVSVRRDGGEVILSLAAHAPPDLATPPVVPPLEGIRIEREAAGAVVRVRVAPEVPYEVRREATLVTLLFGEASATDLASAQAPDDVAELYRRLFPLAPVEPEEEAGGQVVGALEGTENPDEKEDEGGGIGLGPVRLLPSISMTYVDAKATLLSTPEPVEDSYLEIQPRLGARLGVWDGRLQVGYEPRIRGFSSYPQVERASHTLNARLELPVGSRVQLGATEHYVRGLLEANEVDPGGEYFFQLGSFTRNQAGASLRVEVGPRLALDFGGSFNRVRFSEPSGFFDYDVRSGRGGVRFEATPSLQLFAHYFVESVPAPAARREAESEAQGGEIGFRGEPLPLTTGEVVVGFRDQESPNAAEGGRRYRGLTASASLKREFSRAASLSMAASRQTPLSAFGANAFYVATSLESEVTLPLPYEVSLRGGAGYRWNDYRTVAEALGEPRADRIFGWSFGLGRPVTRWAYVRADYRRDRRNSNLDDFDVESEALNVQVGIGFFGSTSRR